MVGATRHLKLVIYIGQKKLELMMCLVGFS